MPSLGASDLDVFPLALGTNSFGWTASPATSRAILDAFVAGGGNFIDTADTYSYWAAGNAPHSDPPARGRPLSKHDPGRPPGASQRMTLATSANVRSFANKIRTVTNPNLRSLHFSARWSRSPLPPLVDGASSAAGPARRFSQAWVR
jgi:hypothetical protein